MTYRPDELLRMLNRHGVRYVVVGGTAAVAHGSPLPTEDVDVSPATDRPNLDRLAAALTEVGARIRTVRDPEGVAFPVDGGFLAALPRMLNLTTMLGDLDIVLAPAGFPDGYRDLRTRAVEIDLGDGRPTLVAALDDVIRSKRTANRTKDVAALPYLEALADEIRGL